MGVASGGPFGGFGLMAGRTWMVRGTTEIPAVRSQDSGQEAHTRLLLCVAAALHGAGVGCAPRFHRRPSSEYWAEAQRPDLALRTVAAPEVYGEEAPQGRFSCRFQVSAKSFPAPQVVRLWLSSADGNSVVGDVFSSFFRHPLMFSYS